MRDWQETLLKRDATIHEAIREIDRVSAQIVLVVDEQQKLLGTVTDGDIRRGILRGLSYEEPVTKIMKKNPVTTGKNVSKNEILELMRINDVARIPVLNEKGQVVGIEFLDNFLSKPTKKDNIVVLMAGGLGLQPRDGRKCSAISYSSRNFLPTFWQHRQAKHQKEQQEEHRQEKHQQ